MTDLATRRPSELVPELGDFSGDVSAQTFDWLSDYAARFRDQPVLREDWRPGQIAALAESLPEDGIGMGTTLDQFEKVIAPGLLAWNHPSFMGFFGISAPVPTVAASTLTTLHNSNGMVRVANPAAPELNFVAGRWLQRLLDFPAGFETQFFTSASQSHMHALCAALNRKTEGRYRREGLPAIGSRFRIYRSVNAHFFADKNAVVTGLGMDNVVTIPVDEDGAMDTPLLRQAIMADLAAGMVPLMVVATVGTTSINAVDPVAAIAEVCEQFGIYLYIDAAFGGAFAALPEFEWIRAGWERADAICVNPHKQLMVPLGCSALFLKDREELRRTFAADAAYIPDDVSPNPMDYTALCGMAVNSLGLIFLIQAFGAAGIRARLRNTVRLAHEFAGWLADDPAFEIVAPYPFTTICFRARLPGRFPPLVADQFNAYIAAIVCASGSVYLSPTKLEGQTVLRLTVGNIGTSEAHVREAYRVIRRAVETAAAMMSFRWPSQAAHRGGGRRDLWSRLPPAAMPPRSTRWATVAQPRL